MTKMLRTSTLAFLAPKLDSIKPSARKKQQKKISASIR